MLRSAEIAPQEIRPLKRAEYDRLVALGAFESDRLELIRGNLVTMAPNQPEHANPIDLLTAIFVRGVGDRARVRVQQPINASDESEPEPGVAVVPRGSYVQRHPDRAHLIVEVALTSLKKDRDVKAPLYAESGFDEYWIVNVAQRCIEIFREPSGGVYTDVTEHGAGSVVSPSAFPDVSVRVSALFE